MIFNFTAEATPRSWTYADQNDKQASKLPDKVAPTDLNDLEPGHFDIPEEKLSDLEQVNEILKQKRLSLVR